MIRVEIIIKGDHIFDHYKKCKEWLVENIGAQDYKSTNVISTWDGACGADSMYFLIGEDFKDKALAFKLRFG